MIIESALLCLSLNVYHEARSEPIMGQQAVALVTMNRANGDPRKVCKVVMASKQFSWTNTLVKRSKRGYVLHKAGIPKETQAWASAKFTARLALRKKLADFTYGARYYHRNDVRPVWRLSMRPVKIAGVGRHLFYRAS